MWSTLLLSLVLTVGSHAAIKKLPAADTCVGQFGITHALDETWEEGDKMCECIYPESLLYFWEGQNPSDAIKFCQFNGCPNPEGGPLLHGGEIFVNSDGDPCICRTGTNPYLMDASTRYHAECFNGLYEYYIDFEQ